MIHSSLWSILCIWDVQFYTWTLYIDVVKQRSSSLRHCFQRWPRVWSFTLSNLSQHISLANTMLFNHYFLSLAVHYFLCTFLIKNKSRFFCYLLLLVNWLFQYKPYQNICLTLSPFAPTSPRKPWAPCSPCDEKAKDYKIHEHTHESLEDDDTEKCFILWLNTQSVMNGKFLLTI